jgi:hypothetical protein
MIRLNISSWLVQEIFLGMVYTKLDCERRCVSEISESVAATTYFRYIFYIFLLQEAYTAEYIEKYFFRNMREIHGCVRRWIVKNRHVFAYAMKAWRLN